MLLAPSQTPFQFWKIGSTKLNEHCFQKLPILDTQNLYSIFLCLYLANIKDRIDSLNLFFLYFHNNALTHLLYVIWNHVFRKYHQKILIMQNLYIYLYIYLSMYLILNKKELFSTCFVYFHDTLTSLNMDSLSVFVLRVHLLQQKRL